MSEKYSAKVFGGNCALSLLFVCFLGWIDSICETSKLASQTVQYTELQPLLSGVHSVMRVKFALAGECGGCTPNAFYYIYHHQ